MKPKRGTKSITEAGSKSQTVDDNNVADVTISDRSVCLKVASSNVATDNSEELLRVHTWKWFLASRVYVLAT